MIISRNKYQTKFVSNFSSIILFTAVIGFVLLYSLTSLSKPTKAYETSCPDYMTDQACLDFLQDQAEQIANDKKQLNNRISAEEYAQLDLYDKIAYLQNQISFTEDNIDELEVQLNQKNVEIRLLNKDIETTQNNIDTASQEIVRLQDAIQKRIALSYKYSSISSVELLVSFSKVDSLMRRLKYLKDAKERDRELLAGMSSQIKALEEEQEILAGKKEEVKEIKAEAEAKKDELFAEKEKLDSQQSEYQGLYAQSQARESEYRANYAALKAVEDAATAQITQLIFELFKSGTIAANTPVNAGDIIGFQGSSGMTFGAHLHFEYRVNGYITNPNNSCFGASLHTYAYPINCVVPMNGSYVTQFPHVYNYAVDMVSYYDGDQTGRLKYFPELNCAGYHRPAGYYSTQGTGAPVKAIKSGKATTVQTDICGGRYVIIDHGNGESSLYLHLN